MMTSTETRTVTRWLTEVKEVVVEKQVEVVKWKTQWRDREIVRTVTQPNGTTIVEKIVEKSGSNAAETKKEEVKIDEKSKVEVKESVVTTAKLPRYWLGVECEPITAITENVIGSLHIQGGVRLGNWPVFVTGSVPVSGPYGQFTVGLSINF
jgi:hypothetical protein